MVEAKITIIVGAIATLIGLLIGGWTAWTLTKDHYELILAKVNTLAEVAKAETKLIEERHEKILLDVSNAWSRELGNVRSNAVTRYIDRVRPVPCESGMPGDAPSPTGTTEAPEELLSCRPEFVSDCAEDAAKVIKWQDWYNRVKD